MTLSNLKKMTFEQLRPLLRNQAALIGRVDSTDFYPSPLTAAGLTVDLAKHSMNATLFDCFDSWLQCRLFSQQREALFQGATVNATESRPALHTALRYPVDGNVVPCVEQAKDQVLPVRQRMRDTVDAVYRHRVCGLSGEPIRHVINIGIGGSDLGPAMAVEALKSHVHPDLDFHFLSNTDDSFTEQTLSQLDPGRTLVLVVSKSFRTAETLSNAKLVRSWLKSHFDSVGPAFYGITANTDAAIEFGLDADRVLPMWDWVGGRFSLWSAVGLSVALAIGMDDFEQMLAGAHAMDQHFFQADWRVNIPVQMGLLGAWYANVAQARTQAVIVYSSFLRLFPDYLQQLHMESLGKRVDQQGRSLDYATGQVLWGGVGTLSQHSFHQLLMCGTHFTPVDFILPLQDSKGRANTDLIANCLAQSEALLHGSGPLNTDIDHAGHRHIPGGTPSTLIMMDRLTPFTLGALTALYEHKVFVQSVLWDINAFDQWGVEKGKVLAGGVKACLDDTELDPQFSASTQRLIHRIKKGHLE